MRLNSHPLDPIALVTGLLFVVIGLGVVADRLWDDVDLAVVAGASIVATGVALIVMLVSSRILDEKAADPNADENADDWADR